MSSVPSSEATTQQVAVVTGASSGIGEAASRSLARRGFRLVLAGRRIDLLSRLAAEIESQGGEALAVRTDLVDSAQTQGLVEQAMARFGRIDVLVNNAGYGEGGPIELLGRDSMRRQFEVNLYAALELCGLVAPIMRRQGCGRIINVSSLSARLSGPLGGLYCATKGAMDRATDALRLELLPWNIRVVLVAPGLIDTEIFATAIEAARPLAEQPNNPYQAMMERTGALIEVRMKRAVRPDVIGKVIAKAATARRPRVRYVAPFSAWLLWTASPLIPQRVIDFVLRRAVGIEVKRLS